MTSAERRFGSTGRALPRVGQGTWMMEQDPEAAVVALREGLDLGMTLVDTAEMYGSGGVEQIVRRAIAGRRDDVFLVSKVLPHNASRQGTREACERSLQRLGVEQLDLYLLHWPGEHPLVETFAVFDELQRAGKLAAWGVSNFDADELDAAVRLVGPGRIACNQVLYHLGERSIEHAVRASCREHDMALMAYSPFGQGDFPVPGSPGRAVLDDVAAAHGVSAHAVALAFLMTDESVFTIPKASRVEHTRANARALTLGLAPDQWARVDEAFPRGPARAGVPML